MIVRLRIPEVDDPDLSVDMTYEGKPTLKLVGSADSAAVGPLAEMLASVDAELRTRKTREVVVDLHGLDAMSAACFRTIIAWVTRVAEGEQRYRIRFRSNPAIRWQLASLRALSCFDTQVVVIES